ncbi:MAG: NAD(P)-dependent oxidoreductase [Hydrogenophilaceae bacterium]|jgi:3-hydroxyisobutyrate dehydrogenase-like beta-hydroxyacid dehydrogenase|nr:NAD(P)-dependent oxidoreductase [Hydrogenophilaceae bacterium]
MTRVAFIGLGVMGAPMAGHLAQAGHEVRVYNRSPEKAQAWASAHNGMACGGVAEAAQNAEAAILCVGDDRDVRAVFDAALSALAPDALLIDHTTASASLARSLSDEAKANGRAFVDAPVSGGQAGAEAGKLAIMVGGDAADFARAAPLMQPYAAAITHIGPAGCGQLAKMVNQICIAGIVQGLAEGLHFADAAGLDIEKVIGAISKGAAQSWQMENRWRTMRDGKFDFGFAVDWMRKDLGLVLAEARANGASTPVAALVDQFYAEVQAMGGGRWDTSSLIARLSRR